MGDESTGFYPYEIDQSLRFDVVRQNLKKHHQVMVIEKNGHQVGGLKRTNLGELQYVVWCFLLW